MHNGDMMSWTSWILPVSFVGALAACVAVLVASVTRSLRARAGRDALFTLLGGGLWLVAMLATPVLLFTAGLTWSVGAWDHRYHPVQDAGYVAILIGLTAASRVPALLLLGVPRPPPEAP